MGHMKRIGDTHKLICTECVTIVINRGHRYRSLLSAERYLLARSRNLGSRRIFRRGGEGRGGGQADHKFPASLQLTLSQSEQIIRNAADAKFTDAVEGTNVR